MGEGTVMKRDLGKHMAPCDTWPLFEPSFKKKKTWKKKSKTLGEI